MNIHEITEKFRGKPASEVKLVNDYFRIRIASITTYFIYKRRSLIVVSATLTFSLMFRRMLRGKRRTTPNTFRQANFALFIKSAGIALMIFESS